jgi:hypothetical protein
MLSRIFIITALLFFVNHSFANIQFKNASKDKTAQNLFDNGMLAFYGYLYSQAEYNFRQALIYDPNCAVCYWGLALAKKKQALELGLPFSKVGYNDIIKAKILVNSNNEFYYDLIQTADQSFTLNNISSKQLQLNYINSLKKLYEKYKSNDEWHIESLALYVDAIAYYSNVDDNSSMASHCGNISNNILKQQALTIMEPILKDSKYPDHPGILHTYIHMAEQKLDDPLGIIAAEKLSKFSNNVVAHYTHMPNHIYWRRGMYEKAIEANLNAINIDENYFKNNGAGLNSYYYEYHYLHSHHFLAILGVLTNNYELSIKFAREVKNKMDPSRMETLVNYRDTFLTLEHLILARFEKWDEIILLETPKQLGQLGNLFVDFSKALAYLNLNKKENFKKIILNIKKKKSLNKGTVEIQKLVDTYLLASEMALNKQPIKNIENFFYKNSVHKIEKNLFSYNPPLWFFPYQLMLSNEAAKRNDFINSKKYHTLFQNIYPKSELGKIYTIQK